MNVSSIDISDKWNALVSNTIRTFHADVALSNRVITVATAVGAVALAVISSFVFPEFASLILVCVAFLISPAVEFSRYFLNKAYEADKFYLQSFTAERIYSRLLATDFSNPRAAALQEHWQIRALASKSKYKKAYDKALEKAAEARTSDRIVTKYRLEALEAEKEAKTIQVYALFLESLCSREDIFNQVFHKYGENLSSVFSEFGLWDMRDTSRRAMDPKFSKTDPLFLFDNPSIAPISYGEVFKRSKQKQLKERLLHAVSERFNIDVI